MTITVNNKKYRLFRGATVKDALLRVFTREGRDRNLLDTVETYDKWGHEIDLDATLNEGSEISYQIKE